MNLVTWLRLPTGVNTVIQDLRDKKGEAQKQWEYANEHSQYEAKQYFDGKCTGLQIAINKLESLKCSKQ